MNQFDVITSFLSLGLPQIPFLQVNQFQYLMKKHRLKTEIASNYFQQQLYFPSFIPEIIWSKTL